MQTAMETMEKKPMEEKRRVETLTQHTSSRVMSDQSMQTYSVDQAVIEAGVQKVVETLLSDDMIEEVMYNSPRESVKIIHKQHHSMDTNVMITSDEAMAFAVDTATYNKKVLSEGDPLLDGVLPDGSRINITIPPATATVTFTIRKFSDKVISILDLINEGLDPKIAAFLWTTVEGLGNGGANTLIVGGTASGKTTFLNALTLCVPQEERVITIEDTAEVRVMQENRVSMTANKMVSMDLLLKNALRMRPDRIIVGEVRGSEAITLFNAMNTGHKGCMGTLHAQSARESITRITNTPLNVPLPMLRDLDVIIVLEKVTVKGQEMRVVKEIAELEMLAGDQVSFNQIYTYDPKKNKTVSTGIPSRLRAKIVQAAGLDMKTFEKIIEDRTNVLSIAATKDLSTFKMFEVLNKNREHWKEYKGKRKFGVLKRKEEELIYL